MNKIAWGFIKPTSHLRRSMHCIGALVAFSASALPAQMIQSAAPLNEDTFLSGENVNTYLVSPKMRSVPHEQGGDITHVQLEAPPAPPQSVPPTGIPRLPPLERTLKFAPNIPACKEHKKNGTLVVFDSTGAWNFLGEMYAQQTANLVSHFGNWKAIPSTSYTAGAMDNYGAVIYIGSTYDEPLPLAFLADVRSGTRPIIWMYDNIWQLTAEFPDFAGTTGWMWSGFDFSSFTNVTYKNTPLERNPLNGGGIMGTSISDPAKAQVLATVTKPDGTVIPWALRSGNFTYISEIPFSYVGHNDRYLAFADLLFDLLAPTTPTQHRALVRIEDVGPDSDPAELRAVADVLAARRIPFSVAVYPQYRDPLGANNDGNPESYTLRNRPKVVSALRYMHAKGGTLLMHGLSHQYSNVKNPYSGASGDDFEFFTAYIDTGNNVVYSGPVPEDSRNWVLRRIGSGLLRFLEAGLPLPTIFEVPHYAASDIDYKAIDTVFHTRYDRGLYFPGLLTGTAPDYTRLNGQFFPYLVQDIYGSTVIPENLGNVEPVSQNNNPPRFPADILATAQKNLVIRDGFASFFYHPDYGTPMLAEILDGLKDQGWTFVPVNSITK